MAIRWQDYIEERKDVMMGKPVFKGPRLTIDHVLKEMGTGMTDQELLENYPTLRPEHIRAALLYAADVVAMDQTIYAWPIKAVKRLFADENMARAIVVRLGDQGHDVLYASDIQPGAADFDWLNRAEAEARIILTADKDFGGLIFRDHLTSHGIVLLRLGDMPLKDRLIRLEHAWPSVKAHPVGKFIVITPTKIRERDLMK
jgi:uncharacterized protein (DUF433 family)/predicted nuclease of predicted toxin-antitoxin system